MSHFYATIQGNRGSASRCGTVSSGIETITASWNGAVRVDLSCEIGQDTASVWLIPWKGKGVDLRLYEGPVNPQPLGDVDAALRCRTCVNYCNWQRNQGQLPNCVGQSPNAKKEV